jgi:adenine-specific DNA methylase
MEKNNVYEGDCLLELGKLDKLSINMIYLDPPFFTQKKQSLRDSNGILFEFSDVWESREDYLSYIKERLKEMYRVLKEDGSLFLHCDSSSSHYLKMLLDEVFGEKNFRSEIIWTYRRWSNSKKGLLPSHQTIFWYSKSNSYKFNVLYRDYSPTTNIDQILQERERNAEGKSVYKRDTKGETVVAKNKRGVPLSDVWEIPFLNPKAKERTGYPTQKPIELLERIINISTDEGDLILDPFCGSGTTLVSAHLLNRSYIGIDINPDAINMTSERLKNPVKSESKLLKVGANAYKTKTDEELAILKSFDCNIVQRNNGIDAILKKQYNDAPVAVKIQKEDESLTDAINALGSAGKKKKCSYTVLISRGGCILSESLIPQNMIVLDMYNIMLEKELAKRI